MRTRILDRNLKKSDIFICFLLLIDHLILLSKGTLNKIQPTIE